MATDPDSGRRMEALMERLRARTQRTWDQTYKVMRMSLMDKRQTTELQEKPALQQHLEVLQKAFKATSVGSMVERLQLVARSVSLKFTVSANGTDIVLSSDMFWVQVTLDATSLVKDATISHSGDATTRSCPELVDALSRSDFDEVQAHMEGLIAIYQINGDKKQRSKLLPTLHALETDLQQLYQLSQSIINGVSFHIHKSPLGILQPRVGGKPMRLTYFVGPYDLLDEKTGVSHPLTVEEVTKHQLGFSAIIGVEGSTLRQLQCVPVMTVQAVDGKTLPSFSGLTHANSNILPAVFSLRLHRPVPLSLSVVRKIQIMTSVEFADLSQTRPLLSLILAQVTNGKHESFDKEKGLFVTLSDQQHCYFMNGVNGTADMAGLMVKSIPFTHPCHVPKILLALRQQVVFNSFIGSCMRANPSKDLENSLIFEVTPLSLSHVSVTFEHPIRESMATAEFDLTEITNVRCRICSSEEDNICTDIYACSVVQRSLSLPVTMRSILSKATGEIDQALQLQAAMAQPQPQTNRSKLGQERRTAFLNTHGQRDAQFTPPIYIPKPLQENMEQAMDHNFRHPNNIQPENFDPYKAADQISKTPILANLLDQDSGSPSTSMLSALLVDSPQPNAVHKKKQRKRRGTTDAKSPSTGKSPKRKMSEDEVGRDFVASGCDSDSTPAGSQQAQQQAANTGRTNQSTNEDFGMQESHVSRLASTLDSIIKAETKNYPTSHPQVSSEMGPAFMNDIDMKESVKRIKEENGGEGVTVKTEPSATRETMHPPKVMQSSLEALLNDGPSDSKKSSPNSILTTQPSAHSGRTGSSKLTGSPKNSVLAPGGIPTTLSSMGHTPLSTAKSSSSSISNRKPSLSKNDSFEHSNESASRDASGGSNSLLAKMISDFPEKSESEPAARRPSSHGSSSTTTASSSGTPPSSNSSITVLSKSSSQSSASSTDKKSPDRTTSWTEDKVLIKEKKNRERSKDDAEKPGITMKLNIKDLTATTIVKASPSRDSPHHSQDSESGRSLNKESGSSSYSKSSKDSKIVKASPARVYDLIDDSPTNTNVTRTMIVATDGKPGSPSIRIKKIRSDGSSSSSSSEKKRKSSKHSDMNDMGKRKKEDSKKDKSSSKRRKIYVGSSSEYGENKSMSSLEKGPTTIKITSSGTKLVQSSSKPTPPRSSGKSSLVSQSSRSSSNMLKMHSSEKSSKTARPMSGKTMMRSKSESQAMKMGDSKLIRTATIKLKPLVIPGSGTTVTVTNTKSASTAPVSRSNSDLLAAALAKNKAQNKPRKNLSAVIDKLTKQQNPPGSGPGGLGIPRRDLPKDPITKKNELEAIRKEIIRAGNKPSTPTKEIYKSSQRKDQSSFSLDKSDRKSDHLNRSSLASSNSLPKIGTKIPSNSSSKLSSSKSSSSSNSSSTNSSSNSGDSLLKASSLSLSSKDTTTASSGSTSSSSLKSSSSSSLSQSSSSSSAFSHVDSSSGGSKVKSLPAPPTTHANNATVGAGHHGPSDSLSNSRSDSSDSSSINTSKRDAGFHSKDSSASSHRDRESMSSHYKDSHNTYSHRDSYRDSHTKESAHHKDGHTSSSSNSKDSSSSLSQKDSSSSSGPSYSLSTHSSSTYSAPAPSLGPTLPVSSQSASSLSSSSSSSSNTATSSSSSSSSASLSQSSSTSSSVTAYNKDTAKELSLTSAPVSSSSSSSTPSFMQDKSRANKANKLTEDHFDRTQSRHFLDAVNKIEHSSGPPLSSSHKEGERKPASRNNSDSGSSRNSTDIQRGNSSESSSRTEQSRCSDNNNQNVDNRHSISSIGASSTTTDKSKPNGQISNHSSRPYEGRPVDPRLYKDESSSGNTGSKPESSRIVNQASELVNGTLSSSSHSLVGGLTGSNKVSPSRGSNSGSSMGPSLCNATGGLVMNHSGSSSSSSSVVSSNSNTATLTTSTTIPTTAATSSGTTSSRHPVLNSDSSSSEDKENKEDEKLFKAPTPKGNKNSDVCDVVNERHEPKPVRRESMVFSPHSDGSSPDDRLIIDSPGSPGGVLSPAPPPKSKPSPRDRSPVNAVLDNQCRSPVSFLNNKSPRSPAPCKIVAKSPAPSPTVKSPMMPRKSPVSAQQHHSPCEIDDDLMDDALIL